MRLRHALLLWFCILTSFGSALGSTTPAEAAAIAAARQDHTAYTLAPAALAKAITLKRLGLTSHFGGELWTILVLFLLLQSGVAARMRNVAVNLTKNRWGQCAIFVLELLLFLTVLSLPLRLYRHSIGLAYGLSVQGWGSWLLDLGKSFLVEYVLVTPVVYFIFWRIRRSPRWWWLQAAGIVMVLSVAGTFAMPYLFDPLFNHFAPLAQTDPALVEQLERVVARGHGISIPPDRMFVMKASEKVTTLNAYVTGFGASKRVVVWDTTLARATPDEILGIFGHEMGHYVLGHVVAGIWIGCPLILLSFFLGYLVFNWLLKRNGKRWRIGAPDHWAALVVLALVFEIFGFFGEPLVNPIARYQEHAADVYGQEVIHGIVADPQKTMQRTFQDIGAASFDDPNPGPLDFWVDTHPETSFRAAFARHYDPWAPGYAPKYFKK